MYCAVWAAACFQLICLNNIKECALSLINLTHASIVAQRACAVVDMQQGPLAMGYSQWLPLTICC